MSTTTPQTKNRLILLAVILIVLIIVGVWMAARWIMPTPNTSSVGSRIPTAGLKYCSVDPSRLCVLSFGQVLNGPLQVELLAPSADQPEFNLNVSNNGVQSMYECKSLEESPEHVYCTGSVQAPGSILALSVISKAGNQMLARGTFSMVGIAILSPQESGPVSAEQRGFRIPEAPRRTPLPTPVPTHPTPARSTPIPSPSAPSYPNPPSYP